MLQVNAVWRTFSAAPHRMMFLFGAVQGLVAIAWWQIELLGRYTPGWLPPAWVIPATWAHGFLMIYGFFPFFIFGFLMTVYPSWMNGTKIPPQRYVPAFLLLAGGMLLFYVGLILGKPLLAAGVALMLGGWGIALYALLDVLITSRHPDKLHPRITTFSLAAGWLGTVTACRVGSGRGVGARRCNSPLSGSASSWTFTEPSRFRRARPQRIQVGAWSGCSTMQYAK